MSELAIGFLVIGALFFVGSFFLQEKLSSSDMDEIKGLGEKEMKSILESNVKKANEQIASLLEEKLEDKVNELEVRSDKEVNDKLLSIGEFSDTVFDSMKKTHEEIMFLYQMLNDKQEKLTEMTTSIGNAQSQIRAILSSLPDQEVIAKVAASQKMPAAVAEESTDPSSTVESSVAEIYTPKDLDPSPEMQKTTEKPKPVSVPRKEEAQLEAALDAILQKEQQPQERAEVKQPEETPKQPVAKSRTAGDSKALRSQILTMHHQGYSQIEIAKKTGRGLGEIQLILELFDEGEETA